MITMKDPTFTVYPNREQMLALIQSRATAGLGDRVDEKSSADPVFPPPSPTCVFHIET